jgi:bacillopeptidase F
MVAQAAQDFRGGLLQQGEGAATAATWRTVKTASAFGGSYVVDHLAGASASYRFTSSSIIWYTNIGPNYGIADLYVDGVIKAAVNAYSPTTHYRAAFTVSGLTFATHTLTIRARGARGSTHGTGSDVAVDAFRTGSSTIASPTVSYVWGTVKASAASGGAYARSDEAGSAVSFTFRGTGIAWDSVRGQSMGRALVYIDGVFKVSIDNYYGTTQYGYTRAFSGLTDGVHTIKILVLGNHRAGATGSLITIDRWIVT